MKSIKKIITNEQIINKSKFINYLIPVKSVDETIDHLACIGQEHPNASHLFNKFNTSAIKTKLSKTLDKLKPMATGKFVHSAVITLNNGDRKIIYFPDGLSDNKTSIYLKTNQYQCVDFKSGYGGFKIKIYDEINKITDE